MGVGLLQPENRGRRWRLILAPLGVLLLLATFYMLAGPRVRSVVPAPAAASVAKSQGLRIEFSRPMDRASVERRLAITPPVDGQFRWQDRTLTFEPNEGWPEGNQISVRLAAGARSSLFLPLPSAFEWSFRVRPTRVAYLLFDNGNTVLQARGPMEDQPETLAEASDGVSDYAISFEGTRLAVLAREADGAVIRLQGGDLDSPEEVHRCSSDSRCGGLALSPAGDWLAWEEQPLARSATGVLQPGPREIWLKQVEGEAPAQSIGEGHSERHSPRWIGSDRLAYYDEGRSSLIVVERSSSGWRELAAIENVLGEHWTWSPDSRFVVFPEVEFVAEGASVVAGVDFFSHLYRVEVETGLRTDLSAPAAGFVEDASPAYSPDGLWLAFARKSLEPDEWSLGRQLWLMRADGSAARALTDDPAYNHAQIAWRPDSLALAFVRSDQRGLGQPSEIWWYDLESGEYEMLVEGGYAPQWIR